MTTQEVANRLVALCREGKYEQAVTELYSPAIVSVEPEGVPNRVVRGLEAVAEKGANFESKLEKVNSSFISDPIVAESFFACSMLMNVRMKGVPGAVNMNEVCVYTVEDGKNRQGRILLHATTPGCLICQVITLQLSLYEMPGQAFANLRLRRDFF